MEPRATTEAPAPPAETSAIKGISRRAPVVLGAVTGMLLCVAAIALASLLAPHKPDPSPTARALCDDLTSQRYAAAYTLLSPTLRAAGTQTQFIANQRQLDAMRGRATRCAYSITSADTTAAVLTLTVTRGATRAARADVRLIHEGDGWLVDVFDTSLVRAPLRSPLREVAG